MKTFKIKLGAALLSTLCLLTAVYGQITPSGDAYTNTADPVTNYGAATVLGVNGATQVAYIKFDLSSIPAGATISQATLKLYVTTVTTGGNFNVDYVNGTWAESTITSSLAPALGTTIVSSVPVTAADTNQYILINVTPALEAWLNDSQANDGIALVANGTFHATFDSKENTGTSHPAELDVVFAEGIAGVSTAAGSGLTGGGTSGTLNLSLTNSCAANQVLRWTGSAWTCASVGTGTVTSVASGTGLTGGPITGSGTLSINTAVVPLLSTANHFTANQNVVGSVTATSFSGSGAGLTGVNASELDGLAASAFAQLSTADTFTASLNMVGDTRVDFDGLNKGSVSPGIRFGTGSNTGEGISSDRAGTLNVNGIDLYTDFAARLSITNSGNIGIGTPTPAFTLDVRGNGSFNNGVTGSSSVVGANGVTGGSSATSGTSNGVYGSTSSPVGTGTVGVNFSTGGYGVYGQSNGTASGSTGVYGTVSGTGSGDTFGVFGINSGLDYEFEAGVGGVVRAHSTTGTTYFNSAGVWGDGLGFCCGYGVLGTGDQRIGVGALNNSAGDDDIPTLYAINSSTTSGALVFFAGGTADSGSCQSDVDGNLSCSGSITANVPDAEGRRLRVYGLASPGNWFEDFGSGQLSTGSTKIMLDPVFASTVNTGEAYHVFLTPNGDCKGLYVANKTAGGFEVRELGGGASSTSFDYRIVAKRRGYESVRMEDMTDQTSRMRRRQAEMQAKRSAGIPTVAPRAAAPEIIPEVSPRIQPTRISSLKSPSVR